MSKFPKRKELDDVIPLHKAIINKKHMAVYNHQTKKSTTSVHCTIWNLEIEDLEKEEIRKKLSNVTNVTLLFSALAKSPLLEFRDLMPTGFAVAKTFEAFKLVADTLNAYEKIPYNNLYDLRAKYKTMLAKYGIKIDHFYVT